MSTTCSRRGGFALREVVVVSIVAVAGLIVWLPSCGRAGGSPEIGTRVKCASNLKTIGTAYQLWAGDHGGFFAPRCRSSRFVKGGVHCELREVPVGHSGIHPVTEEVPYACAPDNGLGIVGNPTLKPGAKLGSANPNDYNDAHQYPLNCYVIPDWKLGVEFDFTRCPDDRNTLIAPGDLKVAGIEPGSVTSSYAIHGTSFATNIQSELPWRGHGAWLFPVGNPENVTCGPNFSLEKIYAPSRYMMMGDLGLFHGNWEKFVGADRIGKKSGQGKWHEGERGGRWVHGNVLFGDSHVWSGRHTIPVAGSGLIDLSPYQGLYPYRLPADGLAK